MKASAILKEAIDTFGPDHQLGKLAEECAEYIEAYFHYKDGRPGALDDLRSEVADIRNVSRQVVHILGKEEIGLLQQAKLKKLSLEIEKIKALRGLR